ncbi:hypothetical protein L6452_22146 [Arctium lappa]|uniref:Uncharacterized protein n=1 Tax=Arctium lappa TaxID=4217 RepID=A0ACB9AZ10_ARCLA|nr:hypothetical protein L6452_22146 [Arctium lappa]
MIGGSSKKSATRKAAHVQEVVSKTGPEAVKSKEAQILEAIVEINKPNLEEGAVKSAGPYVPHCNNFEAQLGVNIENNQAYMENPEDLNGKDVDVAFLHNANLEVVKVGVEAASGGNQAAMSNELGISDSYDRLEDFGSHIGRLGCV